MSASAIQLGYRVAAEVCARGGLHIIKRQEDVDAAWGDIATEVGLPVSRLAKVGLRVSYSRFRSDVPPLRTM